MHRSELEGLGWRQGSFLKYQTILQIKESLKSDFQILPDNLMLVASQSCDVASAQEEYIELSIAHSLDINSFQKQYSYNRHPRILHIKASTSSSDEIIALELKAHEKVLIEKSLLIDHVPDKNTCLSAENLSQYVDWLAGRYKRPALPTKFDCLISSADKKNKRKKTAKRANDCLLGIYVRIYPNRDIKDDEVYSVDLLGIIPDDISKEKALKALEDYASIMKDAGMDVSPVRVGTEFQISVGTLRQYQRINFDFLSYELNSALPPDTIL